MLRPQAIAIEVKRARATGDRKGCGLGAGICPRGAITSSGPYGDHMPPEAFRRIENPADIASTYAANVIARKPLNRRGQSQSASPTLKTHTGHATHAIAGNRPGRYHREAASAPAKQSRAT